jgi:large subunit ribosomal protein L31
MQDKIHPRWYHMLVKCACGTTFQTASTRPTLSVEICSNCHPFYTGKQRSVSREGQVEKFHQRYAKKAEEAAKK